MLKTYLLPVKLLIGHLTERAKIQVKFFPYPQWMKYSIRLILTQRSVGKNMRPLSPNLLLYGSTRWCVHSGVRSTAVHQCNTSGVLGCQHQRHQSLWEMRVPEAQRTVRRGPGTSVLSGPLGFDRDPGISSAASHSTTVPSWALGNGV